MPWAPTRCSSASRSSTSSSSDDERCEYRSENGMLGMMADATFAELRQPDVLVFPGGVGTRPLQHDEEVVEWVRQAHAHHPVHHVGVHRLTGARRRRAPDGPDRHDALGVLPRTGRARRPTHGATGGRAPRPTAHHGRRRLERDRHGIAAGRAAGRPYRSRSGPVDDRVRPPAPVRFGLAGQGVRRPSSPGWPSTPPSGAERRRSRCTSSMRPMSHPW